MDDVKFVVFQRPADDLDLLPMWHWRLELFPARDIAQSVEGFNTAEEASDAADLVRDLALRAPIERG